MNDEMELRILWLGVEDVSGLWEAAFEVLDLEPGLARHQAQARAGRALKELSRLGFIHLSRGPEPWTADTSVPLSAREVSHVLGEDSSWRVPRCHGDLAVRFETTAEGFAWYRGQRGWPDDRQGIDRGVRRKARTMTRDLEQAMADLVDLFTDRLPESLLLDVKELACFREWLLALETLGEQMNEVGVVPSLAEWELLERLALAAGATSGRFDFLRPRDPRAGA